MTFIERLKDATIGFSGYPRLARDSRGAFGYIAVLLAIVVAINGYMNLVLVRGIAEGLSRQVSAMPEFGIRAGRFYFDGPMPHTVKAGDGTLVIIDTTGRTTPESLAGQRVALITAERYYVLDPALPTRQMEFALITVDLTKSDLLQALTYGPERLISLIYPFVYLFQLGAKAIDAAILALIGMLYGSIARRPVHFDLAFRLGLYALSLPTIIQWVWRDFHTWTPIGFAIWWSLATIYLLFGLQACFRE